MTKISSKTRGGWLRSLSLLAPIASVLLTGCETGGGFNLFGSGNSVTAQGNYHGTSPGGITVGGTGTVTKTSGQPPQVGAIIYLSFPLGDGSTRRSNPKVEYVHPDNTTVDLRADQIY